MPSRLKPRRRTALIWIAGLLAVGDLFLVVPSVLHGKREWVTYAGLDSAAYMVPVKRTASAYMHDRWRPALDDTKIESLRIDGQEVPVDYVTLTADPTFGQFVRVIRDLKNRGRCNVLIHYPGVRIFEPNAADLDWAFDIPALVLCGQALGDAGIAGPIPKDGYVG